MLFLYDPMFWGNLYLLFWCRLATNFFGQITQNFYVLWPNNKILFVDFWPNLVKNVFWPKIWRNNHFLPPCHIRFIFHFPLISITNEFSAKWKTLKMLFGQNLGKKSSKMLFGQIFWSKLCYLVKTLAICRKSRKS